MLSKGAISSQFGRVSLPSDFGDLMVDEQIAIAEKLAKSHYEKFVKNFIINYEIFGSKSGYYLILFCISECNCKIKIKIVMHFELDWYGGG